MPAVESPRPRLRAIRVPSSRRVDKWVTFPRGEGRGAGAIIDLSAGGLAFETSEPHGLTLGQALAQVEITFAGREVYCGPAVVRSLRDQGKRHIVGLSVAEGFLPVGHAVELDDRARLAEEIEGELKRLARVSELPPVLKATVAETRYYLEGLRRKLDEVDARLRRLPQHATQRLGQAALEAVAPALSERLTHFARRLGEIAAHRELGEQDAFRRYVQAEVGLILREAPIVRRVFEKPLGHAMDYEVLALALRGAEGPTLFARALEQYFCTVGPARALAQRVGELALRLHAEAVRHARPGTPLRILAFGAGAAPELAACLREGGLEHCVLTVLDGDRGALLYAQDQLESVRARGRVALEARFLQYHALELLSESAPHDLLPPQDIIYMPAMLDTLSDRVGARLITTLYSCLREHGAVLGATLVRDDATRFLFEFVGEWFLAHRDEHALRKLALALPPGAFMETEAGEGGRNLYLTVRKK